MCLLDMDFSHSPYANTQIILMEGKICINKNGSRLWNSSMLVRNVDENFCNLKNFVIHPEG